MAMEPQNTVNSASVDKSVSPDPDLPEDEDEADMLWQNIEDYCEAEEQYSPQSTPTNQVIFYPICIGDRIHHPGGQYEILHRLGNGGFSVVWLARDLKRNTSVAMKVMTAGFAGEKEFANQKMLKEASNLEKSRLNLYLDTFHLESPYDEMRRDGMPILHRVLVTPLAGPALSTYDMRFDMSLRSRMAAAKSLLEALRDLHKAGFIHGDINMGNVLWKLDPSFLQEITDSPDQAFGSPPKRWRFAEGEGLRTGHRVIPAKFPRQRLGSQVTLSDFGLLLQDNKTAVEYKLQGAPAYIAPERYHGSDPSPASDLWSFMIVFVYLYLGSHAFPDSAGNAVGHPVVQLRHIRDHLGPLPTAWTDLKYNKTLYASPTEADLADPPASKFPGRLRDDWLKDVAGRLRTYRAQAALGGADNAEKAKWFEHEHKAKKEAEPHALEVIHSIFRYEPGRRLTAGQLLEDPHWVKLMQICGVQDSEKRVQ